MNDALRIVLSYVRQTLHTLPEPCTQDISVEGVQISRDQGLSSLIYPSLSSPSIGAKTRLYFNQEFVHYVQKDETQKSAITALRDLLNKNHIDFIFLKGSHLKFLYPQTYDRTMGDIDVLIRPETLEAVDKLLFQEGYDNYSRSTQHYNYRMRPDIEIEIHPGINYELPDSYQGFLTTLWDRATIKSQNEYRLKVEDELVFLWMHLAKHFQSTGVGLRSILDSGIFMDHYRDSIDLDYLKKVLIDAHLLRFASSIEMLSNLYFGLPKTPILSVDISWEEKEIEYVTAYFLQSGVHGKHRGFNNFVNGMAKHSLNELTIRQGRFIFLVSHIFPSVSHLQGRYRYLVKLPWLLPMAWITRWLRILFLQPKRTFYQFKKLKVTNKTIKSTLDVFHKLGL